MKTAKSYKIILLITAFVLCIATALGMMSATTAKADLTSSSIKPSDYFSGSVKESLSFKDDMVVATLAKGENTFVFNNALVIADFEMQVVVPAGYETVVKFTSDSYYVNGNKKADGSFDKKIENEISLIATETEVDVKLNGVDVANDVVLTDGVVTLGITVENSYIKGNVNGSSFVETDKYYRIKSIDDKAVAAIQMSLEIPETATIVEGEEPELKLVYVDQKVSDTEHKFKQTFVRTNGSLTKAYPRVVLNDTFYKKVYESGEYKYQAVKVFWDRQYSLILNPHSVLGGVYGSDIYLTGNEDEIMFETGTEKPDALSFKKLGDVQFNISGKDGSTVVNYETVSVKVVKEGYDLAGVKDEAAPQYIKDTEAYEGFMYQLERAYKVYDENGDVKHSAALGTTFTIPSLKDLVFDNVSSYEEMTATTYYKSSQVDTSIGSMSFKLSYIGNYLIYVSFADVAGNSIDADAFVSVNDDGQLVYGTYGHDFTFTFNINDDAPIKVDAPVTQGVAYKGIKFSSSKFAVEADGCKLTYVLSYNANVDADKDDAGWVIIPKASTVTDKKYDKDGYTYSEVKAIGYDGTLTFTPTEKGAYKIVCTATSEVSSRMDTDYTIIKVDKEPTQVKVETHWLQNNIWSIVFLSIGGLCLIGIIVLLFIKPKEEIDD